MLDAAPDAEANSAGTLSRRRLLYWLSGGVGAVVVASFAGVELVEHGVLPGKQFLDEIDGACSVPAPALSFAALGPSVDGRFSRRRAGARSATRSRIRPDMGRAAGFRSSSCCTASVTTIARRSSA